MKELGYLIHRLYLKMGDCLLSEGISPTDHESKR